MRSIAELSATARVGFATVLLCALWLLIALAL